MRKMISLSIILTGFTAMASQIIYMRQFLTAFYGNELSISFILAGWLIGGVIGSALLGRFADRIGSKIRAFSSCQVLLALFLIAGIVATNFIKIFLGVYPGEIIPLFPIIVMSFVILAPTCILLGFIFSLSCRIYASEFGAAAPGISGVYILEAIGSIIGGAVTSFILIKLFDALHIMVIFALLNIFAALALALFLDNKKSKALFAAVTSFLAIIIAGAWIFGGLETIEKYSLKKQWPGYEVLDSKNSIYGNILIAKCEEGRSLFNNGLRLYTIPDKPHSEEAAHLALLEHPDPKAVLLIGGGIGGLVEEILKHRVERIDYVELDPSIIEISEKNLPESYYKALKDPRVSIKNTDGRLFVKTTKEKYDCVIIHTGDPYTAENNRYYTAEFFNEVKDALEKGGLISFGLTSSDSYMSKSLAEFLRSVYATLKSVFSEVYVIPGETAYFLASDTAGRLTYDYKILEERTKSRSLDTLYVRDYYLFSKLSPEKIAYSEKVMKPGPDAVINHDFRPNSYYYGLIFWTTLFRDSVFSGILRSVTESVIWRTIGIFIILLAVISAMYRRSFKRAALMAVGTGGFSSMAFQILTLLAFQTMHGYLFYEMGIILTAFMAGLALGALFVSNRVRRAGVRYYRILLIAIQGDLIIFPVLLGVIFSKFSPGYLFPILSIIAGSIGGAQFALANNILLGEGRDVPLENYSRAGRVGGLSYGIDLLGSFFGALLTGVFLIPILGIPRTCFAVALINLSVLGLLVFNLSIEE